MLDPQIPTKTDTLMRKAALAEIKRAKREAEEARMPISKADLSDLFDVIDGALVESCNHTPQHTRAFLVEKGLPEAEIITSLEEFGGYCDCEVLANVEDYWGDRL